MFLLRLLKKRLLSHFDVHCYFSLLLCASLTALFNGGEKHIFLTGIYCCGRSCGHILLSKKSAQQQKEIPSIEIAIFVHDVCHDK